jgi:hypothetical protein
MCASCWRNRRPTVGSVLARDRRRRAVGPGEELALRHAAPELRDELLRIERHADGIRGKGLAQHVSVGLLGGRETVDLELEPVAASSFVPPSKRA